MRSVITIKTCDLVARIKRRLLIKALLVRCYFQKRRLELLSVSGPDRLLNGNCFLIRWQAKSCYKIVVNGSVVLPGNVSQVYLEPGTVVDHVHLRFYGYGQQLEKKLALYPLNVSLKQRLEPAGGYGPLRLLAAWTMLPQQRELSLLPIVQPLVPCLAPVNSDTFILAEPDFPWLQLAIDPYDPEQFKSL